MTDKLKTYSISTVCMLICCVWLMLCMSGCRTELESLSRDELSDCMFLCDTVAPDGGMILKGRNNQLFFVPKRFAGSLPYNANDRDVLAIPGSGVILWDNWVILMNLKPTNYKKIMEGDLKFATETDEEFDGQLSPFLKNYEIVHLQRNRPSYYLKFMMRGDCYNYYSCQLPFVSYREQPPKQYFEDLEKESLSPIKFKDKKAYYPLYMPVWNTQQRY